LREDDRDRTEGLFRIPGDSENVNKLILMYDALEQKQQQQQRRRQALDDEADSDNDEEAAEDVDNLLDKFTLTVHDVATLMKRYLMKLAQPLIDEQAKKDMIAIYARGKGENKDKQLIAYEVVIRAKDIAEENRVCLAFVLKFLLNIAALAGGGGGGGDESESGGNKMGVENLARVFAPIIMRDDELPSVVGGNVSSATTAKEQMKQVDQIIVVTEILIWNALELVALSAQKE
jgi:RhoGAP domain